MNQQLQTKAMALLTALLQGASSAERQVNALSGVAAVLQLRAESSKPPSHPLQHMLDYLWQRNLRQFIYKVGRGRPGRLTGPPFSGSLTQAWLSSRTLSTVQLPWAMRWLTTCMCCRLLH